jgi:hypothetical protein
VSGVFSAFERFVTTHKPCGDIVGDADEATAFGYRLWMRCRCGAAFDVWITEDDATSDLVYSRMLAGEN